MASTTRLAAVLVVLAAALGLGAYWLTDRSDDTTLQASVAVADAMSSDTTGYARADTVPDFSFPEDHGPHPDFKTEWWYFTGNLDGPSGERIGYQWTLFRIALTPPETDAPLASLGRSTPVPAAEDEASAWTTNQFYMGHFAVSDVTARQHVDAERFSRASAGLAGAQADPLRVWLNDWSLQTLDSTSGATFPVRLRAATADGEGDPVAIDLTLTPEKPPVFQGENGLSQKGPGAGNASYYYSYTRLASEGRVLVGGDTLDVTGSSWLDREWSTSALGPDQVGWDWFAIQLDDGRDLMYYQLRNQDGSPSRFTEGVLVAEDGSATRIQLDDVTLTPTRRWTVPDGSRAYPVAWRLRVPSENLDLTIEAAFDAQEMNTSVRYWEGAIDVRGSHSGRGYLEMTGYGDSAASPTS